MAAVQADPTAAADLRAEAVGYFRRAAAYLSADGPVLVAIGGLSGTGKTTLARGLAPALGAPPGAVVLRSDVIRKQLAGIDETERLGDAAYGPEMSQRVYAEIYRRAAQAIGAGHGAIADAVFAAPAERVAIERVTHAADVRFVGLWLEADAAILKRRVAVRHGDASDAGIAVVDRQLAYRLGTIAWQRIDATGGKGPTLAAARETVRAAASAAGITPRARAGVSPRARSLA
jgi:predicted kinase